MIFIEPGCRQLQTSSAAQLVQSIGHLQVCLHHLKYLPIWSKSFPSFYTQSILGKQLSLFYIQLSKKPVKKAKRHHYSAHFPWQGLQLNPSVGELTILPTFMQPSYQKRGALGCILHQPHLKYPIQAP